MSIKAIFNVNPNLKVEADCSGPKGVFKFAAAVSDILGIRACGNCQSPDLKPVYRKPKGFDYYSLKCNSCGHELRFGQAKETGDLFPKGWSPPYRKEDAAQSYTDEYDAQDEPNNAPPLRRGNSPVSSGEDIAF